MKRIFSIVLVSLLLLNFAGLFIYFPVQLFRIRSEMREKLKSLPDEKLEILTLRRDEYQKALVEDDEIQIDGRMFDIARVKLQGEMVRIYALHDSAEDNLLAFLDEIVNIPLREKKSPPVQILQFISLTFLAPEQNFFTDKETAPIQQDTLYLFSDLVHFLSIESPPPRG